MTNRALAQQAAAFGLTLLVAACGGGGSDDSSRVGREQPAAAAEAMAAGPVKLNCAGCNFGPQTFVRTNGAPNTTLVTLAGDLQANYRVEINDNATQGADAVVTLDGVVLLDARQADDTTPRSVATDIKIGAASTLSIRLLGKPGSTLTVAIRGGVKSVGPNGGTVVMPGGTVTLDIPPNALTNSQVITIEPAPADQRVGRLGNFAVRLGPEGVNFNAPVSIIAKYDPSFFPPEIDPTDLKFLKLGFVTGDSVTEVDSEVNVDERTVRAQTSHFSLWVLSNISTPAYRGPSWGILQTSWKVFDNCLRRETDGKTKDIEALAKTIFKLPGSVKFDDFYVGPGCITAPYLQNKYSLDTYKWDTGKFDTGVPHVPIGLENHAGIDFRAKTPTPAYAVAAGVVMEGTLLQTSEGRSTLIIESQIGGKTYWIFYLHCSFHMNLKIGDSVRTGQQVCVTGSVGASDPHLHFEVKLKGRDLKASGLDWDRALGGSHCPGEQFNADNGAGGFDKLSPGCPKSSVAMRTVDPTAVLHSVGGGVCLSTAPPSGTLPYLALACVDDGSCPSGQVALLIGGNNSANPPIPRVRYCVPR